MSETLIYVGGIIRARIPSVRPDEERHMAGRWLDVKEAAEALGVSSDAVRN